MTRMEAYQTARAMAEGLNPGSQAPIKVAIIEKDVCSFGEYEIVCEVAFLKDLDAFYADGWHLVEII